MHSVLCVYEMSPRVYRWEDCLQAFEVCLATFDTEFRNQTINDFHQFLKSFPSSKYFEWKVREIADSDGECYHSCAPMFRFNQVYIGHSGPPYPMKPEPINVCSFNTALRVTLGQKGWKFIKLEREEDRQNDNQKTCWTFEFQ